MIDMNAVVGSCDLALIVLDTLRYDVANQSAATGQTPNLARVLPGGVWERRHTPASFTYPAHHAFFAGFLPTPAEPGRHSRLFAARFPGSETTSGTTWVFDAPDLVTGLAAAGYHTLCLGGVGFFNRQSALGSVLPSLFAEDHWRPEFGVTEPDSLRAALSWQPEEIYLYPLYIRPVTGLGARAGDHGGQPERLWDVQRLDLYHRGRDLLGAAGYRQLSMRHFRRVDTPDPLAEYHCQTDGMVGLGCGARSYTRNLHYSFDYAVSIPEVRAIVDDYTRRPATDFAHAEIGFPLDGADLRLRWLVKTLLRVEGVDLDAYTARFGTALTDDLSEHLNQLTRRGWATISDRRLMLTTEGIARSDLIGPWVVSDPLRTAMAKAAGR